MKVLIIGNGGREHAIGAKLKQHHDNIELFFAKGNGGTESIGTNINLTEVNEIVHFAKDLQIDITIVGSEALLVQGIVDSFHQYGLKILGPNKKAAQLEGDKAFAKQFMLQHGIRTAKHQAFTNAKTAIDYVTYQKFPLVIKATGLAAGKGVCIAQNFKEACDYINDILLNKIFGDAGNEIVIEEFLDGFEVSVLSIFNKKNIYPFISAKDHKKIFEGDKGPNTGGMGAIAPNPLYTSNIQQDFEKNILQPTLKGLLQDDLIFSGIIFFGLMVVNNECYLLEYNLRMGDPETQTVLPLLNTDLLKVVEDAIDGNAITLDWKHEHSCCIVAASDGYPGNYETGKSITGLNKISTPYFIAGANKIDNKFETNGGRVLNIVATSDSLHEAKNKAYEAVHQIHFDGMYYRKDIGLI
ncbi:MAG: phosphoribosylamine--glycine ligase [Chitinophagaceae bacterium]|nr:phosphoribosylamine--glycine ligase [Chitinophagaceae bacterium]